MVCFPAVDGVVDGRRADRDGWIEGAVPAAASDWGGAGGGAALGVGRELE